MSEKHTENIKVYIPLGIAIISAAVMWGTFSAKVSDGQNLTSNLTDRVTYIESKQSNDDLRYQNVASNIYILCRGLTVNCVPPVK